MYREMMGDDVYLRKRQPVERGGFLPQRTSPLADDVTAPVVSTPAGSRTHLPGREGEFPHPHMVLTRETTADDFGTHFSHWIYTER